MARASFVYQPRRPAQGALHQLVRDCSGRLTLVALIHAPAVITRILTHLGLSVDVPMMRPSRAPPLPFDGDHDQRYHDD